MSLLEQVLDIVALRNEKDIGRNRSEQRESPAHSGSVLQHVWAVEINIVATEAKENISEEVNTAMIYELGKSNGDEWELIDQQQCEIRGDAEESCRGFLSMMNGLGMKQGDSIIVLANEQRWIDCAVREALANATVETGSREAYSAGVVLPPPAGQFVSAEQAEIEQIVAAIRRLKIVEYLKNHLT